MGLSGSTDAPHPFPHQPVLSPTVLPASLDVVDQSGRDPSGAATRPVSARQQPLHRRGSEPEVAQPRCRGRLAVQVWTSPAWRLTSEPPPNGAGIGVGPEVLERIHRDDCIEHPVPQRHGANVTSDCRDVLADSGGLEHRGAPPKAPTDPGRRPRGRTRAPGRPRSHPYPIPGPGLVTRRQFDPDQEVLELPQRVRSHVESQHPLRVILRGAGYRPGLRDPRPGPRPGPSTCEVLVATPFRSSQPRCRGVGAMRSPSHRHERDACWRRQVAE